MCPEMEVSVTGLTLVSIPTFSDNLPEFEKARFRKLVRIILKDTKERQNNRNDQ